MSKLLSAVFVSLLLSDPLVFGKDTSPPVSKRGLDEWVLDLQNRSPLVRLRALQVLGKQGSQANKYAGDVVKLLNDSFAVIRGQAAVSLALMGPIPEAALKPLAHCIRPDEDSKVRYQALVTLGQMGKAASPLAPKISRWVVDEDDPQIRGGCVLFICLYLAKTDTPASEFLVKAINSALTDYDEQVRYFGCRAASLTGANGLILVKNLEELIVGPEYEKISKAAVDALVQIALSVKPIAQQRIHDILSQQLIRQLEDPRELPMAQALFDGLRRACLVHRDVPNILPPADRKGSPSQTLPTPKPSGKLRVLCIGALAYPGSLHLSDAAEGAAALALAFENQGDQLYSQAPQVTLLFDQKATRGAIYSEVQKWSQSLTQEDLGLLFFSGHCDQAHSGEIYLLPTNANPEDLKATAISVSALKSILEKSKGRQLILLDVCCIKPPNTTAGKLPEQVVKHLAGTNRKQILFAAAANQRPAWSIPGLGHGFFSLALLEAFDGAADFNRDGLVDWQELQHYVKERVVRQTKSRETTILKTIDPQENFPLVRVPKEAQSQ